MFTLQQNSFFIHKPCILAYLHFSISQLLLVIERRWLSEVDALGNFATGKFFFNPNGTLLAQVAQLVLSLIVQRNFSSA